MDCPTILDAQSITKGQQRLDKAIEHLGLDVVKKIIGFSLYALGYSYDTIQQNTDLSKAGIKLIVQELYQKGVERFLDRRKKDSYPVLAKVSNREIEPPRGFVTDEECNDFMEFQSTGPISLRIKKDDDIGKKAMALLFCSSNLISQKEAASILGCKRLAVYQNQKKMQSTGVKGLYDNRLGQKTDYQYKPANKSEVIKEFFLSILENRLPSKSSVTERLNASGETSYSERSVAHYLKLLGLTDNKEDIFNNIASAVNKKIDTFAYLYQNNDSVPENENQIQVLKEIKRELVKLSEDSDSDIFRAETKIEEFQSKLQAMMLSSMITSAQNGFSTCSACNSLDIDISIRKKKQDKSIKTSLGGTLIAPNKKLISGTCHSCGYKFDFNKDVLEIADASSLTPLAQKKICSANRAGSYESAVKNLKELLNLDINRSQVRNISTIIGEYIQNEFSTLSSDISKQLPASTISQKHPLVKLLALDKKYFNRSKYLIVIALDGGRMQLCDWIPASEERSKGKKRLHWHECKVFRVSVYDKSTAIDMAPRMKDVVGKGKYESAKIIPGQTTYGATNQSWKDTASLIRSHLYMRGIQPSDVELCLSDGSAHIYNDVLVPLFPDSTHLLDYYHKVEALYKCLDIIGEKGTATENKLKQHLWDGNIDELIQELKEKQELVGFPDAKKRKSDDPKVVFDNFINHLEKNKKRMMYDKFRDKAYPIGSGCIESAVKLFSKRIKGTEKQWSDEGGEAILHLYSFLLSEDGRWDQLWLHNKPWMRMGS